MGHARRFAHATIGKNFIVAWKCVRLQDAAEIGQVRLRVLALAIRRIGEPRGRCRRRSGAPIVAHVDPQASCLGLAIAWREHRHRRVIRMNLARLENVALQRIDQRPHQRPARADPARHRRAVKLDAITRVNGGLAVKRLVVGKLGNEYVRQQSWPGDAAFDGPARRRRLHDMVAAGACLLAPYVANHLEGRIDDFQLLGDGVSADIRTRTELIRDANLKC